MPLFIILLVVFFAGAIGGAVNALLSGNGFMWPKAEPVNGTTIWRPGSLSNIFIGGIAAVVSWGLYGPFSSAYLIGTSPNMGSATQKFGLTLSGFVGAILVGIGGAKWLSDEVDKLLLKAAASEATKKPPAPEMSARIYAASPAETLKLVKKMPDNN